MRRIRQISAALLTTMLLAWMPTLAGYCGIVNFDEETAADEYCNLNGSTIYYEEGVSADELYAAAAAWVQVPSSVLDNLLQYDCRIYLSDTAVSDPDGKAYVTGETHYPVYICNAADMSIVNAEGSAYVVCITADTDITVTVLHEIGHLFDGVISTQESGYIRNATAFTLSSTDTWQRIYEESRSALSQIDRNTALNMYNAEEAFAEVFRLYCSKPQELKDASREAYDYLAEAIARYAG